METSCFYFVLIVLSYRYEVMNQCWLTEAGERPSFEKIAETLGDYLGANLPDGYLAV